MKMKNNAGYEFEVIWRKGNKCKVKFSNTGHIKDALYHNVIKGKCSDPYEPTKLGIGYTGYPDRSKPYWKKARQLWSNMLARSYSDNPKTCGYKWKGVEVDPRWHCFATFLEDIGDLEGFDDWLRNDPPMNLDKDLKVPGNKIYSKSTCQFISETLNKSEGAKATVAEYRRTVEGQEGGN